MRVSEQTVYNAEDRHHPACNERCHGAIHYLKGDDSMGEPVQVVVTGKVVGEDAETVDIYVDGKWAGRASE